MKPNVINFHVTDHCNYRCRYCFASFLRPDLSFADAKRVIDAAEAYFVENGIKNSRINIAGGEPSIYPHLDALIDYICEKGIRVSLISNGSYLTPERVRSWKGKVEMIGLSIDAASEQACLCIGRCQGGNRPQSLSALAEVADAIHACGIRLKINTVVSKLNLNENMRAVYERLKPDKLKLLCVHESKGMMRNEGEHFAPAESAYWNFVARNRYDENCLVVAEEPGYMENAYFMIDPQGDVFLNEHGTAKRYGSCLGESLSSIIQRLPIDMKKFNARY